MTRNVSLEELKEHSSFSSAWIVYKSHVYDITTFLEFHPGGLQVLENHLGTDVTKLLDSYEIHKHSDSAIKLLDSYEIGRIEQPDSANVSNEISEKNDPIDWDRGILFQLEKLGNQYDEWTFVPTSHRIKLFDSKLMEMITKSHWTLVPIVWIPIMLEALRRSHQVAKDSFESPSELKIYLLMGLLTIYGFLFWTLLEYSLHRCLFHWNVNHCNKYIVMLHFSIHGLHHKSPLDPYRLVFPPIPALLLGIILVGIHKTLLGNFLTVGAVGGSILGYISYDMIHYVMHHSQPVDPYLAKMKRIHNVHHFTDHNKGFGISSELWDRIFGTRVKL